MPLYVCAYIYAFTYMSLHVCRYMVNVCPYMYDLIYMPSTNTSIRHIYMPSHRCLYMYVVMCMPYMYVVMCMPYMYAVQMCSWTARQKKKVRLCVCLICMSLCICLICMPYRRVRGTCSWDVFVDGAPSTICYQISLFSAMPPPLF